MFSNLFGKTFKTAFLLIVIAEIISFWAIKLSWLNNILFILICLTVFFFAIKKLEYGLYISLAELFIASKGYLFFFTISSQKISLRIGLFSVIFLVWLVKALFKKERQFLESGWLTSYLILGIFIILGITNGILNNQLSLVFFDANAWLYFLIAPVFFSVFSNEKAVKNVLAILFAAVTYLSLKTLAVLFIFSRGFPLSLDIIYRWIRNSGVGEITYLTENFYRIFFQSQIYILIGLMIALILLILTKPEKSDKIWLAIVAILSSSALIVSLSRSFWLGFAASLFCLLIISIVKFRLPFKKLARIILTIILAGMLELGFLSFLTGNFYPKVLTGRIVSLEEEAAGSSRLQQLSPLVAAVSSQWLLGAGFGKAVTYISNDPRVREKYPDGRYTAYAFEWGYLDIWLKIGLLGLLAYLWLIAKIAASSFKLGLLGLSLGLGLVAIIIANIFSPYLNHPLGIGFIILSSAIISQNYVKQTSEVSH